MAVKHSFTSVSEPSNISIYGEGSFLVGFWGETIKYSKDGKLWYEHPKHYDWSKGNYAELDDTTANDNDKIIDFTSTPIFISNLSIYLVSTADAGTRAYTLEIMGTYDAGNMRASSLVASKSMQIMFTPFDDSDLPLDARHYYQTWSKFWSESIPFWNKIRFRDLNSVSGNDDINIYLKGVYALPKYHWIEFKNCKSFQIQTVTESLSDGVFTIGSSLPRSLKVLKV